MIAKGMLVKLVLRVARLPTLGPVELDTATAARFETAADALLAGSAAPIPEPRLDFSAGSPGAATSSSTARRGRTSTS